MNVLFVCVGNVFRSYSAERFLNIYAEEHKLDLRASSAGIAPKERANIGVSIILEDYGIEDALEHIPRRVTNRIIKNNDVVVGMSGDVIEFLRNYHGCYAKIYNRIARGEATNVDDVPYLTERKARMDYMEKTIAELHESIPGFANTLYYQEGFMEN